MICAAWASFENEHLGRPQEGKGGWGRKNATAGKEKERRRMFFEGLYEEILGDVYAWIRS